ncbi:hypothetical protein [Rufibacter tibetensis]|uniref:Uncharacterized protein n=1 Tax=Rufibacter tibetensis TaxID=512763 RepID=A0A0P0CMM3_9BACT|nr:hypothetical protein [Rufibacter tibetensis]ALI98221.1 hypothetical protein DC20_03525 [Rufibacter tibetensis]
MRKILFYCLAVLTLVSCQEDDATLESPDYLVFGHYHGFCGGESCIEIFKIQDGQLYEDTNDRYPSSNKPYEANFVLKSLDLFEKVKDLPHLVPTRLLQEDRTVIGSPDATDGGGYYLEVGVNGMRRYFLIDKFRHNVPEYLHPFLDQVEASIAKLK